MRAENTLTDSIFEDSLTSSPVLFSNSPNDFGAPANALKPPPPPDAKALKPPVEGVEKAD
jgi:hypothetical protein